MMNNFCNILKCFARSTPSLNDPMSFQIIDVFFHCHCQMSVLVVQYLKIHDQYLSPRLSAALTIERSAAVLRSLEAGQAVECPPWHWESHNQDLGGCSCLQPGAGVCVEEGFRQQVRRSPHPAPAQDGGVARNCPPARPPLRPHRQDGGGLQAWPRPAPLPGAWSTHPRSCCIPGQRDTALLAQVQNTSG